MSLKLFAVMTEIWFFLSCIFPLTKPPGLLITLQTVAMTLSDRLARAFGESTTWSSISFMATIWLKCSLGNITSIYFDDCWQQAFCGWDTSHWWCSIIHILLLLFVGSAWKLLVLLYIMVIIIWTLGDLFSVSVVITPTWQDCKVHTSGWSWPHFFYQLCNRGASGNIPSNTNFTHRVL